MAKGKSKRTAESKATASQSTDARASVHPFKKVRENAEAVIVAVILALIIRHYSLEAFEIPTGSMAPWLHGVHVDATCPNCGTLNPVGLQVDQFSDSLRVNTTRGYIYDGPCSQCETHIRDGVIRPDAPVNCLRCQTSVPGIPPYYKRSSAFAREYVECRECTIRYSQFFEPRDALSGHKILVNKFSYEMSDPERWQVIVFKFNRQRNYIKRLVGLPGETIEIVDGDVVIDGAISRKPLSVQNQMWFPIHDSNVPELGLIESAWEWTEGITGLEVPRSAESVEDAIQFNALDGLSSMRYMRPIRNYYSYNGARGNPNSAPAVRDLSAIVDVKVKGTDRNKDPAVWLDIRNGGVVYRLSLPIEKGAGEILRLDAELAKLIRLPDDRREPDDGGIGDWSVFAQLSETTYLERERSYQVEFAIADRQLRVVIDGHLIHEEHLDPRDADAGLQPPHIAGPNGEPLDTNDIAIRARHCGGDFERIQLFRDIHYTSRGTHYVHAVSEPFYIPVDGYFALGDNSPSSLDSRAWGALSRQNLLGRGFVIFWPALPWRFDVRFIR